MDELYRYGSLTDSGSNSLDGTMTHVAYCKDTGDVGFEQEWVPIELPSLRTLSVAQKVGTGQQKTTLIPLDDIRNTTKIHAVIINGRLLLKDDLKAMLAEIEAHCRKPGSDQPPGVHDRYP